MTVSHLKETSLAIGKQQRCCCRRIPISLLFCAQPRDETLDPANRGIDIEDAVPLYSPATGMVLGQELLGCPGCGFELWVSEDW